MVDQLDVQLPLSDPVLLSIIDYLCLIRNCIIVIGVGEVLNDPSIINCNLHY